MNKNGFPDLKEREKISSDLDQCFFVEAGAGSGKTHSLVDRMVGLIRYSRARIENIAAVTFTRKAAAELRERFQIKLEEVLHEKDVSGTEKDSISSALQTFERASISTIHSFCAGILRERPVEAGIDPGFEEIEEDEDMILAKEVWAEYIEKQAFENNKVVGWMQEKGIRPDSLNNIYTTLVKYSDVEAVREDLPAPDFRGQKEDVKTFLNNLKKKIPSSEPASGWDHLQKTVRRGLKLLSLGYLEDDRLFVELLKVLNKKTGIVVTQNRWPAGDGKEQEDETKRFQERVVVPALRSWGEYLHKPLMDFVMEGARYYDNWRRERSILNFQDLLMRTAKLLRENEEVRAYFKNSISHLLVDEFQDTDPIQAEIIMLLTGEDNSMDDWRNVKPKKGSLFLVGDPKQSIYRFRRADIDIFNQVKNIFQSGAGEVLGLTSNFRSLDPVRDLTNTVFKELFPADDTVYQAKFAPLVTIRGKSGEFDNGVYENIIEKVRGNHPGNVAEIDAQIIASWIDESINGGLRLERTDSEKAAGKNEKAEPGDFMIITKVKKRLPVYAKALEMLAIPYEISGGENFSQSEELYEIYRILKAASDPKDSVALVAALRGMFFGVSDNDLYLFVKGGGRFSYFNEADKGPDIIRKAFARFKKYNGIAASYAPITAIEMIIEDLGVIPFAVSKEIGATRAGNILKAVELLREKKANSIGSFSELIGYLKEMRNVKGIEEMNLFPGATKSVRIMNLHKAKGLEAPVVILADPMGVAGDYDPLLHVKRTKNKSIGYFGITESVGEYSSDFIAVPKDWEGRLIEEKAYESAEKERLDYVAVTRAKNILVVSTYRDGDRKKAWNALFGCLSGMPNLSIKKLVEPKARKSFTIAKKEWMNEKKKIDDGLRMIREESYRSASVTGIVESPEIFVGGVGDGRAWGGVVHKALEACGKGKKDKIESLARNWLIEEGKPLEDLGRLIPLVEGIVKSDMWGRMVNAQEKYFELPFMTLKDGTLVRGVMDLIFKEDGGWVIVDYKTDDFEKFPERKEAYQNQLNMYGELWEKMTGEKVKEKILHKVS